MQRPDLPITTKLTLTDELPLTCTRSGTCCHGKTVRLNPWELARLAEAKGLTPRAFRDQYCDLGGIVLRFDGPRGWKELPACSQYAPGLGCSVHAGRPLVCRLYPLGRQKQGGERSYLYQGSEFPCLEGCPGVLDLPRLSVAAYIEAQDVKRFEAAQDAYLEVMQELADSAFALLLDSGLAASGDRETLRLWREMGGQEPGQLQARLGPEWMDLLMLPELADVLPDPLAFTHAHLDMLLSKAHASFSTLDKAADLRSASVVMMGLALHLGRGLGAEPAELAEHWIKTAKEHGAQD
jgi:Fe-S-cluster containining protein